MWNVTKNYDLYLGNMYGNYMETPEPDEREKHVLLEIRFPDEMNHSSDDIRQDA